MPDHLSQSIELVKAVAWPLVALVSLGIFRRPLLAMLHSIHKRIDAGSPIKFYSVEVGQAPTNLPVPSKDEAVTANHVALVHSSWRYPKKDAEFGKRMWAFHVIVQARDEVLDRIEYVKYFLHKTYPNPVQIVTDRASRFKLKELAYGESIVRCEIKINGQDDLISLTRYINLTDSGPRI